MGFSTGLRRELFAHINSLSYRELDEIGTPTLITRITSDVNQAQTGVNLVLRLFLRSPFIVAGALVMSFTIDVQVALIFLVAVPLISLVIYLIMRWTVPIYREVQKMLDLISRLTRENHVGARVVRAFGRQREEIEAFTRADREFTRIQMSAGRISALLNPATYVIMNLAIVLILWVGGRQVDTGRLTQGEVTALVNYMTQILLALLALANLIVAVTKAMASGTRLNEVFAMTTSLSDEVREEIRTDTDGSRVVFRDVSFSYAHSSSPASCHCVNLINKHNTGGIFLCLFKEIPDTGSPHAHKHLYKIRAGNTKKRHACLPGNSLGKQCLTCSRRAHQQNSFGDSGPQFCVFSGRTQKIYQLLKFLFFFLKTGNPGKIYFFIFIRGHFGTALAKIHHSITAS